MRGVLCYFVMSVAAAVWCVPCFGTVGFKSLRGVFPRLSLYSSKLQSHHSAFASQRELRGVRGLYTCPTQPTDRKCSRVTCTAGPQQCHARSDSPDEWRHQRQ